MLDTLGYYKILDLDYNADEKSIKLNYRDKAKFWHPDHNTSPDALENFQKISVAYDILKNSKTRNIYNLLSLVYTQKEFPDFSTLKIYKNTDGKENPFLRVLNLKKYSDKQFKNEKIIADINDAEKIIKDITKHNWLKGWFNPKKNIEALKFNFKNLNTNNEDNFKMLIHNAAAYLNEDKLDKAYISIKQALLFSNNYTHNNIINTVLNTLPLINYNEPLWDYNHLKNIQLFIPKTIIISIVFPLLVLGALYISQNFQIIFKSKDNKINYYQEVRYNNDSRISVDDVITSKIFNIPVDLYDGKMIYHLKTNTPIMHGPSEQFDVLANGIKKQTVRITGYSPDKTWFRIMLDNGDMGFVKKQYLKKGIGNDIPKDSKIIKQETR